MERIRSQAYSNGLITADESQAVVRVMEHAREQFEKERLGERIQGVLDQAYATNRIGSGMYNALSHAEDLQQAIWDQIKHESSVQQVNAINANTSLQDKLDEISESEKDKIEELEEEMVGASDREIERIERQIERAREDAERERERATREAQRLLDNMNEDSEDNLTVLERIANTAYQSGLLSIEELRAIVSNLDDLPDDLAGLLDMDTPSTTTTSPSSKGGKKSTKNRTPTRTRDISTYEEYEAERAARDQMIADGASWELQLPTFQSKAEFARYKAQIARDFPKMAQGGIVTRPTIAMIGEAGPEAVIPLGKGGMGGQPLYVTLNLDGVELGQAIVSNVNEASRRGELLLQGNFTQ